MTMPRALHRHLEVYVQGDDRSLSADSKPVGYPVTFWPAYQAPVGFQKNDG